MYYQSDFYLTIIVPVYNEEESLHRFIIEIIRFINTSPRKAKILFINDGSTDNSLSIIKRASTRDSRIEYISFKENAGLSAAIKAGIDQIDTPFTGYIDSDLQTTPMDFNFYFEHLDEYKLVNGIRARRNDSYLKKASSKIANGFRRVMINDGIQDTCCPLKIIDSECAKKMPFFKGMHRFIPALIQLQGGKVKQLEVQHFERKAGTSKFNMLNRLVAFFDTLAFVWMKKRYIRYEIDEKKSNKRAPELTPSYEQ